MPTFHVNNGALDVVARKGKSSIATVHRGAGYTRDGSLACILRDTGNGFIATFPAPNSVEQDYYVCLDYSQARELVLALSMFQQELGFAGDTP